MCAQEHLEDETLTFFLLYMSMVESSYIIIVSGMGDDVPVLVAVVTLFDGKV